MVPLWRFLALLGLSFVVVASSTSPLPKREIPTPPQMLRRPPAGLLLFQVAVGIDEIHKPFSLECEATGTPPMKYQWYKDGRVFDFQEHHQRISQEPGQGTLVVTKPMDVDEGYYYCIATNHLGTSVSNSVMVRKSDLGTFPDVAVQEVLAKEGEPLSLRCSNLTGFPKPVFSWTIENNETGAVRDINSSRITVDPEGTLHFTNVTASDGLDDDEYYACMASNVFRNEYKLGNRVKLNVVSSSAMTLQPPSKQYTSPSDIISRRGEPQEIHCIFGGTPQPEIVWHKTGTYTTINGTTLKIKKVDFQDEGVYRCKASNGVSPPVYHFVSITVKGMPYWVTAPNSTNAVEDENVRFECKASGVPEPEVHWFINGVPIEKAPPNPRRKLVSPTVMVIEDLEKTDTAVFQCDASNELGYAFRDFYLNVFANLEPTITEPPEELYETLTSNTVTLRCRAFGAPRPQFSWLRDGNELAGVNYTILRNGDLEITKVKFTDAGRYKCIARNRLGSDSSDDSLGHLEVKEHTVITAPKRDYVVRAGDTATLRCDAVADSTLDLEIKWHRNYRLIDFQEDFRIQKGPNSTLVITETREFDSDRYMCTAITRLDQVWGYATLTVQEISNTPRLVGVKCSKSTALVEWQPMGNNSTPKLKFIIEYNTSFTPDTWEVAFEHVPPSDIKFKVSLTPWVNYTFRVVSVNKYGSSLPSGHSSRCETPPDVPFQNPENVQGQGDKPDNLVISWTAMPQIDHNGPGFFYRVLWKRKDSDDDWMMEDIHDWNRTKFVVSNTPSFVPYAIKVEAHNSWGQTKRAAYAITGYSGEDVPLYKPRNLTLIRRINEYIADLSWSPVPMKSIRGHFKGYKIQSWTMADGIQGLREKVVHNFDKQAQANIFFPFSENFVRVRAFNGKYDGPPSDVLRFNTPEGTPGPVAQLQGFPLGSTALRLVWEPPLERKGMLTGYTIYYQEDKWLTWGPYVDMKPLVEDGSATVARLTGLKPDKRYKVTIRAKTAMGTGVSTFIEVMTGSMVVDGNYTTASDFEEIMSSGSEHTVIRASKRDYVVRAGDTATLRCAAVANSSLDLEIEWLKNGQLMDFEEDPRMNKGPDSALVITETRELDSGIYTCVAKTRLDNATASATLIVQNVPNAPKLIGVKCERNTAVVKWQPMGDNRAPILRFIVEHNTSFTPDHWQMAYERISGSDLNFQVHLTPWTNYTFRVIAVNEVGPSLPSGHSERCETPPDVPYQNPENVQGKGHSPDTLVISWTVMPQIEHNGPGFFYRVFWKWRNSGKDWMMEDIHDWQQTWYMVSHNVTSAQYTIKVEAHNSRGRAEVDALEITGYNDLDPPREPPKNLTLIRIIDEYTAELKWSPVRVKSVGGHSRGYKIQTWTPEEGIQRLRERVVDISKTQTKANIFVPFSENFVRVIAFNGYYDGPPSGVLRFNTPEGTPGPVARFQVFRLGSTAFRLVWKRPLELNGILTGYKIYYQEVLGRMTSGAGVEQHIQSASTTVATLTGLKPDTKYRVYISAMTAVGPGVPAFVEAKTGSTSAAPTDKLPVAENDKMVQTQTSPDKGYPFSYFYVQLREKGEKLDPSNIFILQMVPADENYTTTNNSTIPTRT